MSRMKWMFTLNPDYETWIGDMFDSRESAIEAGLVALAESAPDKPVVLHVGRVDFFDPIGSISADDFCELLSQRAYDCGGDASDSWVQLTECESSELQERIDSIVSVLVDNIFGEPMFGRMVEVETLDIKKWAMLAAARATGFLEKEETSNGE